MSLAQIGIIWTFYKWFTPLVVGGLTLLFGHIFLSAQYGEGYLDKISEGVILPEAFIGLIALPMFIVFISTYLMMRKNKKINKNK